MKFKSPISERYNRMAAQFNINAVNPDSNAILAAWNANATAYNATNPKYPYPSPPPAIYGVWQFAGQNGLPSRTRYTDWTNGAPRIGFAYRLGDKNVIRGGFGVFYQSDTDNQQLSNRLQRHYALPEYIHRRPVSFSLLEPAGKR